MTITFSTFSAVIADIMSYSNLAIQGYGKMAFGAIMGGGVFSKSFNLILTFNYCRSYSSLAVVATIGLEIVIRNHITNDDKRTLIAEQGENMYIFLLITIFCTLWWCMTFDFKARRSAGIFMLCLYALYIVYMVCVEFELIHDFAEDLFLPVEDKI